jgi:hypothetical protein
MMITGLPDLAGSKQLFTWPDSIAVANGLERHVLLVICSSVMYLTVCKKKGTINKTPKKTPKNPFFTIYTV